MIKNKMVECMIGSEKKIENQRKRNTNILY